MSSSLAQNLYGEGVSLIGVNHKTLALSEREILSEFGRKVENFFDRSAIDSGVVLSTCNRFEIVTSGSDNAKKAYSLIKEMLGPSLAESACYQYLDRQAVKHLFRVVSSLDSMVIGETQIVGQVKRSYEKAHELGRANKMLHHLFQFSFNLSKRVKHHTGLGGKGLSMSYVAVQLVAQIFESFEDLNVLVIGSGQMAELVVLHLKARGVKNITIVNRTLARAVELAQRFEAHALQLDRLEYALSKADVVVGSIAAEAPVLTKQDVARYKKPNALLLVDLGVPRNFSPNIETLDEVYLYDVDHLGQFIQKNQDFRVEAARDAEIIVDYGIIQFEKWLARLRAEPHALKLRDKIDFICKAELARTLNKSGLEVPQDKRDELLHRISRKLVHHMTSVLLEEGVTQHSPAELLGLHFDDLLDLE